MHQSISIQLVTFVGLLMFGLPLFPNIDLIAGGSFTSFTCTPDTSARNTLRLTAIASLTMEDLTLAESRNDISGEDSSSEEEWYNPNDEETERNAFDIMDDELNTM